MNTREAAASLNVTPKALRRHLRANPEWEGAGIGGSYSFTAEDIKKLRKQLQPKPVEKDDGYEWMNEDTGIDVDLMLKAKSDPKLRAAIRARRRARRQKLGSQLFSHGVIDRINFERNYR